MKPILLATQSKYKIALFETLGIAFETAPPPFEEHHNPKLSPRDLAMGLARGKAVSLADQYPNHLIIGADQVLAFEDQIFSKPGTVDAAVVQLGKLVGKTHALHTAFAVLEPSTGRAVEDVVDAQITFHDRLAPDFLRAMVEADQTTDCVGGYKFESQGVLLMKQVATSDTNAIVGLPLIALVSALAEWGYFQDRFLP